MACAATDNSSRWTAPPWFMASGCNGCLHMVATLDPDMHHSSSFGWCEILGALAWYHMVFWGLALEVGRCVGGLGPPILQKRLNRYFAQPLVCHAFQFFCCYFLLCAFRPCFMRIWRPRNINKKQIKRRKGPLKRTPCKFPFVHRLRMGFWAALNVLSLRLLTSNAWVTLCWHWRKGLGMLRWSCVCNSNWKTTPVVAWTAPRWRNLLSQFSLRVHSEGLSFRAVGFW